MLQGINDIQFLSMVTKTIAFSSSYLKNLDLYIDFENNMNKRVVLPQIKIERWFDEISFKAILNYYI